MQILLHIKQGGICKHSQIGTIGRKWGVLVHNYALLISHFLFSLTTQKFPYLTHSLSHFILTYLTTSPLTQTPIFTYALSLLVTHP